MPSAWGADEILYMATAGGAHAMQLEDCDRLAVGKKADIVMIDLNQPNMQPENNIVKNLVYSGSKQNVKMTMINGKVLYEDNHFEIGFDPKGDLSACECDHRPHEIEIIRFAGQNF